MSLGDRMGESYRRSKLWVEDRWWVVFPTFLMYTVGMVGYVGTTTQIYGYRLWRDPRFLLWSGREMMAGNWVYISHWDIKPPLIHYVAAVMAFATGGNESVIRALGPALMILLVTVTTGLIAHLVYELTGDPIGAAVSGIGVLALDTFHIQIRGFGVEPFAVLFIVLTIHCYHTRRPVWAGATAALAGGFWQLGIGVIVALCIAAAIDDQLRAVVAGGIPVAAVTVIPTIAAGGFTEMVVQTVVVPIIVDKPQPFYDRFFELLTRLDVTIFVITFGFFGCIAALLRIKRSTHRSPALKLVPMLFAVYFAHPIFNELGTLPDIIPLFVVSLIACGVLIPFLPRTTNPIDGRSMVILLLVFSSTIGGAWVFTTPVPGGLYVELEEDSEYCHVRDSQKEIQWITWLQKHVYKDQTTEQIQTHRYCWDGDLRKLIATII